MGRDNIMRGIELLHPEMQVLANRLVSECAKQGLKVKITDTWRTLAEQNAISSQFSKVKYPSSYHCWGIAFDICRNDGRKAYDDSDGFFAKVGKVANSMGLDWGGNLWTDFTDKPHFQISTYGTPKQLIKKYGNPKAFKKTWKAEVEQVEKIKINVNGKVKTVEAINKDGQNYVKLRDLASDGIAINYDKMPIITTK